MTRTHFEIRERALRAAAAVALFSGFSCQVTETPLDEPVEDDDPGQATLVPTRHRPEIARMKAMDAGVADGGEEADAGLADSGEEADAGFAADATTSPDSGICERGDDVEAYLECCKAIGWDWDRGCAAWGPPAPPRFEVA